MTPGEPAGRPAAPAAALLRAEIDAVLADWAWHLDHGELDQLAALFTADALFVTGGLELRGRSAIRNRYAQRTAVRSTRHMYSGLRVSPDDGGTPGGGAPGSGAPGSGTPGGGAPGSGAPGSGTPGGGTPGGGRPGRVRAWSTWVNYAANRAVPADDVGVYLVADFHDVLTWCADGRWRISERRIIPVFRDPSRAPVTA